MNWTHLQPLSAIKKNKITVKLVVPEKRGKPSLQISIPSAISGQLYLDANGVEGCYVMAGDEGTPNEGQLRIQPATDGPFRLKRLAHTILISVPPPRGLALEEQSDEVVHAMTVGGFIIILPAWARRSSDVAPSKAAGDKPAALELNGNILILGGREAKLTKQQAVIMEKLNSRFGKLVTKGALHAALYADDADGGADEKIVDVMICKIRDLIKDWPIVIHTHWGKGYELRRAIT